MSSTSTSRNDYVIFMAFDKVTEFSKGSTMNIGNGKQI